MHPSILPPWCLLQPANHSAWFAACWPTKNEQVRKRPTLLANVGQLFEHTTDFFCQHSLLANTCWPTFVGRVPARVRAQFTSMYRAAVSPHVLLLLIYNQISVRARTNHDHHARGCGQYKLNEGHRADRIPVEDSRTLFSDVGERESAYRAVADVLVSLRRHCRLPHPIIVEQHSTPTTYAKLS